MLWKALQKWYKEKQKQEGIFHEEWEKAFTWLQFDASKQTLFGTNPSISIWLVKFMLTNLKG